MNRGELLQWDSAYNVYHQPQNRFVATFVGRGAWLPGNVIADGGLSTELGVIRGEMTQHFSRGTEVEVFLRPDDVVHDDASPLRLQVLRRQFRGSDFLYELALESGVKLLSLVPSHHDHAPGEFLGVRIETEHMVVFRRG
jgi:iron(III) transport system ATP-binding protein